MAQCTIKILSRTVCAPVVAKAARQVSFHRSKLFRNVDIEAAWSNARSVPDAVLRFDLKQLIQLNLMNDTSRPQKVFPGLREKSASVAGLRYRYRR
jgi:hypothetical protein